MALGRAVKEYRMGFRNGWVSDMVGRLKPSPLLGWVEVVTDVEFACCPACPSRL
jgi:hypothetical protein